MNAAGFPASSTAELTHFARSSKGAVWMHTKTTHHLVHPKPYVAAGQEPPIEGR